VRPQRGRTSEAQPARRDYLAAIAAGNRRPIREIAVAYRVTTSKARDMVHEARERGLLSKGKSGVMGGKILPRAQQLLSEGESK